jgi:hypothetical protein
LLLAAAGAALLALVLLPPLALPVLLASSFLVVVVVLLLLESSAAVFLPDPALKAKIARNSTAAAARPFRTSGFSSSTASFACSVLASADSACA